MKYIKVTNYSKQRVYINIEEISSFCEYRDNELQTRINLKNGYTYDIRESIEFVERLIKEAE